MRKFVLVLVALLATVSMAAEPFITLVSGPANSGEVDIMYTADGSDANLLPSGFGLNVQLSGDATANIIQVKNYKQGVSTSASKGYGIFPGQVVISGTPAGISDANTPVEFGDDVAGVTINSDANVVLEMGALYDRGITADRPVMGTATRLCTIVVDKSCTVTVTGDARRCGDGKGIVAQNYTAYPIDADNTVALDVTISTDCFPSNDPAYPKWVAWNKPASWCYPCWRNGDVTGDNLVLFGDVIQVLNDFKAGNTTGRSDATMDGLLLFGDVIQVLNKFKAGTTCN